MPHLNGSIQCELCKTVCSVILGVDHQSLSGCNKAKYLHENKKFDMGHVPQPPSLTSHLIRLDEGGELVGGRFVARQGGVDPVKVLKKFATL